MGLEHYERDLRFGAGIYRRLIRIVPANDWVISTINDTHHSLWIAVQHRAGTIEDIRGQLERYPATPCAAAGAGLKALVGLSLSSSSEEISRRLPTGLNCTHLGDLARWSIRAARSRSVPTTYQIAIPDSYGEPAWMEIKRNGRAVHRWLVQSHVIVEPLELTGRPLLKGFFSWARELFDDDDLEAAIMLQRGAWVARGRQFIVDEQQLPLNLAHDMKGACFSYSAENWNDGTNNVGYVRDFTERVSEHPLPEYLTRLLGPCAAFFGDGSLA